MTNLFKNLITLNFDDKYPDENYSLNSCKIFEDIIPNMSINTLEEERFLIKKSNQFLGNKRNKDSKEIKSKQRKPHNKYTFDNLKRICKHLVIESAKDFINKKIYEEYNGDIGEGILKKKLLQLNQKQKKNSTAEFNKEFINKTLKDILSEKITKRIKYYKDDHNKVVIEKVLKEKKDKFEKLFDITFIECLEHFIGIKQYDELKGLTLFNEYKDKIVKKYKEDGENYYQNLELFMTEFKERINNAKPRQKKKVKNEDISES